MFLLIYIHIITMLIFWTWNKNTFKRSNHLQERKCRRTKLQSWEFFLCYPSILCHGVEIAPILKKVAWWVKFNNFTSIKDHHSVERTQVKNNHLLNRLPAGWTQSLLLLKLKKIYWFVHLYCPTCLLVQLWKEEENYRKPKDGYNTL